MGTRSRMCHGVWEVWVRGGSANIRMSKLIIVRSMVSYYVCCRNYMYTYILIYIYIQCEILTYIHTYSMMQNPS